jgi:F-type H+-transporting ATPase subunit alpha
VSLVLALQTGLLDPLSLEDIAKFRSDLPAWLDRSVAPIVTMIDRTGQIEDVRIGELKATLSALVAQFVPPVSDPRTK